MCCLMLVLGAAATRYERRGRKEKRGKKRMGNTRAKKKKKIKERQKETTTKRIVGAKMPIRHDQQYPSFCFVLFFGRFVIEWAILGGLSLSKGKTAPLGSSVRSPGRKKRAKCHSKRVAAKKKKTPQGSFFPPSTSTQKKNSRVLCPQTLTEGDRAKGVPFFWAEVEWAREDLREGGRNIHKKRKLSCSALTLSPRVGIGPAGP